jgi:hypothetical protein
LEFFGKLQIFHPNSTLDYLVPASWGAIEDKSNPQIRRWPETTVSHAIVSAGVGALDWVPKQYNQSEKPLLWHHSGLTTPGNLRGLRMLLPGLLLWKPRQQSRKNKPPLSWRKDISVKFASGTWTGTVHSHGKSQNNRIRVVHSS